MFQLNLFQDDVPLKKKPGEWSFLAKICEKHLWKIKILSKDAGHRPASLLKMSPFYMFFKHFASKNQLPGFSVTGTLAVNG